MSSGFLLRPLAPRSGWVLGLGFGEGCPLTPLIDPRAWSKRVDSRRAPSVRTLRSASVSHSAEILIARRAARPTLLDVSGPEPLVPEPERPDHSSGAALTTDDGPALRDARSIAARIAEDEVQADEARERYQADGLPIMEADDRLTPLLQPDEIPHAMHASAMLEMGTTGGNGRHPVGGTLYLTSRRLIHLGEQVAEVPLASIEEMAVALGRLLLIRLQDGLDLALEVAHPRLLRVQIAAAKAAARGRGR